MTLEAVLTRAITALFIVIAGVALYRLYNYWLIARARRAMQQPMPQARERDLERGPMFLPEADCLPGIAGARKGVPLVLYFTTPDCAPCKTIQRPALRSLQAQLGDDLQVIEIDALEQPELASRWGVLSVPTTFILDPSGRLRHVNHGVTRAEKLLTQVQGVR